MLYNIIWHSEIDFASNHDNCGLKHTEIYWLFSLDLMNILNFTSDLDHLDLTWVVTWLYVGV